MGLQHLQLAAWLECTTCGCACARRQHPQVLGTLQPSPCHSCQWAAEWYRRRHLMHLQGTGLVLAGRGSPSCCRPGSPTWCILLLVQPGGDLDTQQLDWYRGVTKPLLQIEQRLRQLLSFSGGPADFLVRLVWPSCRSSSASCSWQSALRWSRKSWRTCSAAETTPTWS